MISADRVDGLDFLSGGGEMGALMRSFDWSRTPLGAPRSWSPALSTTVRILLANGLPMLLWWGPQYISIYNDASGPFSERSTPGASANRAASAGPKSGVS